MGKFEYSGLSNLSVDRLTIRTSPALPALLIDFLAYLCALQVIDSRSSQVLEE